MRIRKHQSGRLLREGGLGLIELMVALVIGLFLILGALTVYSQGRNTHRSLETVARLQETARYAFDALEPDVRMASYWGLASRPDYVTNRAAPGDDTPADLAAASGAIDACGSNWVIDVDQYIAGWNGLHGWGLACDAYQDSYRAGTDGLIVRRVSENRPAGLTDYRLYIQGSHVQGTIFIGDGSCTDPDNAACIPAGYAPSTSATRELIATAYYIADVSVGRVDVPALRRKRLVAGSVLDEEVISGVEDLQVRFGIDTSGDASADAYIDPSEDPAAYGGRIVAATIWLRVRTEEPDFGFSDTRTYSYADLEEDAPNDHFRRLVVSKTIALRNARS